MKVLSRGGCFQVPVSVNKIFPKESLLEEGRKFFRKFAPKGAVAVRLVLEAVNQRLDLPFERGLELEASLAGLTWDRSMPRKGQGLFWRSESLFPRTAERGK